MTTFTNSLPMPAGKPFRAALGQTTLGAKTAGFPAHRQYRYYCTHLLILLPNNDSLVSIHPHSFGSGYNKPKESFLSLSHDCPSLSPFLVFALNLDSSNADQCHYFGDDVRDAYPHSPISLGASGLQGDIGVMTFWPCRFLDALIEAADVLFTRCGVLISSLFDVALILFTRCPRVASQEGRFA